MSNSNESLKAFDTVVIENTPEDRDLPLCSGNDENVGPRRVCSFRDCGSQAESLGFCGGHYAQYRSGKILSEIKTEGEIILIRNVEWIAGLFEGEGSVSIHKNKNGYSYPKLILGMTDPDVIVKLYLSVGAGNFQVREFKYKKTMYYWSLSNKNDCFKLLKELLPHMGVRRSERMKEAIIVLEDALIPKNCEWCPNTYIPKTRGTKYCSIKCRKKANR